MQTYAIRFALFILLISITVTTIPIYILYRLNNSDLYGLSEVALISIAYVILIGGMSQPVIGLMWHFFERHQVESFDLSVLVMTIIYISIGSLIFGLYFYYTMALKISEPTIDIIRISNEHPAMWIAFVLWWLFGFVACLNIGITHDRK